ncbi:MAG: aspartate aminotransferase [Candidatus Synechococcus spongiarum 15L]|uniref:Aminotransferase n=1 Tax=Candidatus Synechococcus spongiarum 15L TaxID=1608419 RepID=A0A0G8AXK2_9SYNE|nr:MAG: aspartate aminotransferase [Candidatus Synechococcus spongiarum 15L]MCY4673668.1 pyridoxal phosphate-dependent aminotransferase [Bacteroidota bacterium]
MPTSFNPRVASMQPSATLAMAGRAKKLKRAGADVIALSAGEPDFNTPEPIAEAGIQAIREGFTRYTQNPGMPELREAICEKFARENNLEYAPAQILCSNGAKQSVAMAVSVLAAEGDEVLIPAPYWVSYPEMTRFAGAKPVIVHTTAETQYRLTPQQLADALTERTRVLILCSPSNPTGSVYTHEELAALAEVLHGHEQVVVVSDEIYEHVIYDAIHVPIASLPGMQERTITVNGFSKCFAMTGWRLGYMAGPEDIVKQAAKMQGQFTSAPSSISQRAGIAALNMDMKPIRAMVQAFRERRDYLLERMSAVQGIHAPKPEGAFYLFPQCSDYYGTVAPSGRTINSSDDLCFYLLEEHLVALVPGAAFGDPNGIRISYAASMDDLQKAFDRIIFGLLQLTR